MQLIERIKHFFDVPNLVFVLLLNRKQLENAIRGVYGPETDAATYLGKFVHLFFRLPKNTSRNTKSYRHPTPAFITDVLKRFDFNASQATLASAKNFKDDLSLWVVIDDMSLRDIERACALFVISNVQRTGFITYLIVLKLKHHALYERLVRNDASAHKEEFSRLASLIEEKNKNSNEMRWPDNYFKSLQELHGLQVGGSLVTEAPCFAAYGGELFGFRGFDKLSTFSNAFNCIDLPVETY